MAKPRGGNKNNKSPKPQTTPIVEKTEVTSKLPEVTEKTVEEVLPSVNETGSEESAMNTGGVPIVTETAPEVLSDAPAQEITSAGPPSEPAATVPENDSVPEQPPVVDDSAERSNEIIVAENDAADGEVKEMVESAEVALTPGTESTAPIISKDKAPEVKEETYKDRLYAEAVQNKDRMLKLKAALENKTVPESEVEILTEQYGVMHKLAVILNTRLGRA